MDTLQASTQTVVQNISIAILDDESLFVDGLSFLLEKNKHFTVTMQCTNGNDFLEQYNTIEEKPEILLLDLNMAPMTGIQVLEQICLMEKPPKVLVLSSHYNASMYGYMIKYGIYGFLPKHCEADELFTAIKTIHQGRFYLNEENQKMLQAYVENKKNQNTATPWKNAHLSERELEILKLICQEYSTKEIAQHLYLSIKTVESHRSKIMEKICCKNVIGMVIYAVVNGIYVVPK